VGAVCGVGEELATVRAPIMRSVMGEGCWWVVRQQTLSNLFPGVGQEEADGDVCAPIQP